LAAEQAEPGTDENNFWQRGVGTGHCGHDNSSDAKGCIKGAVVGGIAGHFAGHHGLLGAAAGCVIGHHEAKKHERENAPAESR